MKGIIISAAAVCCLLSGCSLNSTANDVNVGDINTENNAVSIEDAETGNIGAGEIDTGIYVRIEEDGIYSVEWECRDESGGVTEAGGHVLEKNIDMLFSQDIVKAAEKEGKPIDFTITAIKKDKEVFAKEIFTCQPGTKRMELTITQEGTILQQ